MRFRRMGTRLGGLLCLAGVWWATPAGAQVGDSDFIVRVPAPAADLVEVVFSESLVPEPSTALLIAVGLLGIAVLGRRRPASARPIAAQSDSSLPIRR